MIHDPSSMTDPSTAAGVQPSIHAVFVGGPKTIADKRGEWVSSICRDPVSGPVNVFEGGLEGDAVAQPYHGSPDAAICAHLLDHYLFWNRHHGMALQPGMVGENVTLAGLTEDEVCIGDMVQAGTALLEVSGPRLPCVTLARRIGRPDFVRMTMQANRSGFYLRVLRNGRLSAGDRWQLCDRFNPDASIPNINRAIFLDFDADFARRMLDMRSLAAWWKAEAAQRLAAHTATEV